MEKGTGRSKRLFMSFCKEALVFKDVCTKLSNIVPSWPPAPFLRFFPTSCYCDAYPQVGRCLCPSHNHYSQLNWCFRTRQPRYTLNLADVSLTIPQRGWYQLSNTLSLADVSPAIPSAWLMSAQQYPQLGWSDVSPAIPSAWPMSAQAIPSDGWCQPSNTLSLADVSPAIPSAWLMSTQQYHQLGWQPSNTLSLNQMWGIILALFGF
jgi:hypothetical protein